MTELPKTFRVKSFGCQMNVYDGERMGELLAAQGMTAASGEDADLVVLNTCHIREKAADRAYSDVGRLEREDGSRPMVALAGCVAQAEGAEAGKRSKNDRHRRRPAGLSPPARNGRRRSPPGERPVDTDMPRDRQVRRASRRAAARARRRSSRCRKGATNSAPIASCPTPAAPRSAARSPTSSTEAQALVDGGAREITLLGQNVNAYRRRARHADPRHRPDRWARAHPLHHQPPRRHERRADRRAWRGRQVDALSPLAGAVGQRPHPQGDEPQPQRRNLSAHDREGPRRAARHRHLGRLHRRLPRRDRKRFRGHARHRRCGGLRLGLFVQIFAPAGHAGGEHGRSG